jgi:hypothetical protein
MLKNVILNYDLENKDVLNIYAIPNQDSIIFHLKTSRTNWYYSITNSKSFFILNGSISVYLGNPIVKTNIIDAYNISEEIYYKQPLTILKDIAFSTSTKFKISNKQFDLTPHRDIIKKYYLRLTKALTSAL